MKRQDFLLYSPLVSTSQSSFFLIHRELVCTFVCLSLCFMPCDSSLMQDYIASDSLLPWAKRKKKLISLLTKLQCVSLSLKIQRTSKSGNFYIWKSGNLWKTSDFSNKKPSNFFIMYFELIAYNILRNKLVEFGTWNLHCLVKLCHFRTKQQKNSSIIFLRACYQLGTEWYWIHEFKLPKTSPTSQFILFLFLL